MLGPHGTPTASEIVARVLADVATPPRDELRVALVGNPNCGKSTIFNALTGGSRAVGNWAGVTVDEGLGRFVHAGTTVELIDLPGVYSLSPSTRDEQVTRTIVAAGALDLVVNVLDASNLERNLYLTMQLAELERPMVVVLNMGDAATEAGTTIDAAQLSAMLGCTVVETCAARRSGLEALRVAITAAGTSAQPATVAHAALPPEVAAAVTELSAALEPDDDATSPARWRAIRLLEFDEAVASTCAPGVVDLRDRLLEAIESTLDEEADILLADARYERVGEVVAACVQRRGRLGTSRTEQLDRIALHPRFGIPVFLGVMYVMFLLTITFGSAFIDLFDQLGGLLFVDLPAAALHGMGVPEALVVLLANGIGGGLQSVATFVPPVGIMFLCLRLLEESGYMARAAFVMDRAMRGLGLPGKAFVPMIVGFGCNVPAIMGARTLERERDRKLAVALNPFMSCGARLPVYALFAAAFFPSSGQLVVFALYLLGIGFAVLTGLILKRTLLEGELTPFVMELPPYHVPTATSVLRGAWARLRSFIVGAGKLIVPVVAALTVLGSIGTDGSLGNEDTDASVLSAIGRTITPAFAPMGIEQDNWPATVGIFTGIFAKEAVVGSLDALYSQLGGADAPAADELVDPAAQAAAAVATVPPNLADALRDMVDPLGLSVGTIDSPEAAAVEQGVDPATYGAMVTRFDGQVGAFAYLVFILLYLPCVAATAAIYRETGRAWATFVGCWTTGLAFAAATIVYQASTFAEHPTTSTMWIAGLAALFALVVARLRRVGSDDQEEPAGLQVPPPPQVQAAALAAAPAPVEPQVARVPPAAVPTPARPLAPATPWPRRPLFADLPPVAPTAPAPQPAAAPSTHRHVAAVTHPVRPDPALPVPSRRHQLDRRGAALTRSVRFMPEETDVG